MKAIYQTIKNFIYAINAYALEQFRSSPPIPVVQSEERKPIRPEKNKNNKEEAINPSEEVGAFFFKERILDHLDVYFRIIKRFRKTDRDAYNLYSQIGALILPKRSTTMFGKLPAYWLKQRPAFGAIWLGYDHADRSTADDDDTIGIKFAYFHKLTYPIEGVQYVPDSDLYQVTAYYDEETTNSRWLKKHGVCLTFYCALPYNSTTPILLKQKLSEQRRLPVSRKRNILTGGRGRKNKSAVTVINNSYWGYPRALKDLKKFSTERNAGEGIFCMAAGFSDGVESGIRVDVKNQDGETAVFCVEMKRTAYFFKDREVTITKNGKKAKIFHIVRAHMRTLKTGRSIPIKFHFRGLRRFVWNGFHVGLSVPGRDHTSIRDFSVASELENENEELSMEKFTSKDIGFSWANHIGGRPLNFDHSQRAERG